MFHHYEDGLDSTNQKTCTINKTPPPCDQDTTSNRPTPCANHCVYMRSFATWTLRSVISTGLKSWDYSCGSPYPLICAFGVTLPTPWAFQNDTEKSKTELSPFCMRPAQKGTSEFRLQEGINMKHVIDGIASVCSNKRSAVPQGF